MNGHVRWFDISKMMKFKSGNVSKVRVITKRPKVVYAIFVYYKIGNLFPIGWNTKSL